MKIKTPLDPKTSCKRTGDRSFHLQSTHGYFFFNYTVRNIAFDLSLDKGSSYHQPTFAFYNFPITFHLLFTTFFLVTEFHMFSYDNLPLLTFMHLYMRLSCKIMILAVLSKHVPTKVNEWFKSSLTSNIQIVLLGHVRY